MEGTDGALRPYVYYTYSPQLRGRARQYSSHYKGHRVVETTDGLAKSLTGGRCTKSTAAFLRGLKDAGFVEGRNVSIEYRWTDDRPERLPELAGELIGRRVAVIVANQPAALAAKAASATVPVVFVTGADPVSAGLVTSMNRPGGNVTGIVFTVGDLTGKRLGLLRDLVPSASVMGALVDPNAPASGQVLRGVEEAGRALGVQIEIAEVSSPPELEAVFATIVRARAGGLLVSGGGFFLGQMDQIVALAARHRLPATYSLRSFVEAGGLMSYGPSQLMPIIAPATTSAASSRATSRPTCRWSRRPNSSWSSTSRPPRRSASTCRRRCSRAPTR